MARAGKIEEERNRIVHSGWGGDTSNGTVTRTKVTAKERRGFEITHEEYTDRQLREFARHVRRVTLESLAFNPWRDQRPPGELSLV